jgi:hypothetical protein
VRLSSEAEAAGYRLSVLDETDSTSNDALAAARAGDPGRHWFVARRQSAGRGRHGRQWASPLGNLYASLLLVEPCPPAVAPQLGFLAGIAAHDAVSRVTGIGAPRLALKWPNDLILDGGKLAGLLLEGQFLQPGGMFCVAGRHRRERRSGAARHALSDPYARGRQRCRPRSRISSPHCRAPSRKPTSPGAPRRRKDATLSEPCGKPGSRERPGSAAP